MKSAEVNVLAIGLGVCPRATVRPPARVVWVRSLRQAAERLRAQAFDLVLVRADFSRAENVRWVERLRAAKPFVPVVVVTNGRSVSPFVEARLRATGVGAVLHERHEMWRTWIDQ